MEQISFFDKSGFDIFGAGHDPRTAQCVHHVALQKRGKRINHRAEEYMNPVLEAEQKLAIVAAHTLYRVAAIDGAAALAIFTKLLF